MAVASRPQRHSDIRYASTFAAEATGTCEWEGCSADGAYPAPVSPADLRARRWFCLDHVREYNRAWNYYANMTADEIERERQRDTIWQRPTWPFSRGNMAADARPADAGQRRTAVRGRLPQTADERQAAKELDLSLPYTEDSLKACYRSRAKAAHPDLNPDEPNAEERFKRLREAYMTLLSPLTK
jgi:hypothetical protein